MPFHVFARFLKAFFFRCAPSARILFFLARAFGAHSFFGAHLRHALRFFRRAPLVRSRFFSAHAFGTHSLFCRPAPSARIRFFVRHAPFLACNCCWNRCPSGPKKLQKYTGSQVPWDSYMDNWIPIWGLIGFQIFLFQAAYRYKFIFPGLYCAT